MTDRPDVPPGAPYDEPWGYPHLDPPDASDEDLCGAHGHQWWGVDDDRRHCYCGLRWDLDPDVVDDWIVGLCSRIPKGLAMVIILTNHQFAPAAGVDWVRPVTAAVVAELERLGVTGPQIADRVDRLVATGRLVRNDGRLWAPPAR